MVGSHLKRLDDAQCPKVGRHGYYGLSSATGEFSWLFALHCDVLCFRCMCGECGDAKVVLETELLTKASASVGPPKSRHPSDVTLLRKQIIVSQHFLMLHHGPLIAITMEQHSALNTITIFFHGAGVFTAVRPAASHTSLQRAHGKTMSLSQRNEL